MVASSRSISDPNTVLNTIVADALCNFADALENVTPEEMEQKALELIQKELKEHQRIIFNGNGYSEEWVAEAGKRGLPNEASIVGAIPALLAENTVSVFEKHGVLSRAELESRMEVSYETYVKTLAIEARTMLDMASSLYIPAVIRYTAELAAAIHTIQTAVPEADNSVQKKLLKEVSSLLVKAQKAKEALAKKLEKANAAEGIRKRAEEFNKTVGPAMDALRKPIDTLEGIVDKKIWPVPTYGDLLFEV